MNPSGNEVSGNQLPPPIVEQGAGRAATASEAAPQQPEQAPAGSETAVGPSVALPTIQLPLPPVPVPSAMQDDTTTTTVPATVTPTAVTDDGDLIEKEWVNKAKQIVEQNREDPHKQSEELTVFKADYMQKRYGKTIKLSQ